MKRIISLAVLTIAAQSQNLVDAAPAAPEKEAVDQAKQDIAMRLGLLRKEGKAEADEEAKTKKAAEMFKAAIDAKK